MGTRPEAIKLFPVVHALRGHDELEVQVCLTAQHRALVDQVLGLANIAPEIDLNLMRPDQSLDDLTVRLLRGLGQAFDRRRPDRVIVQGDTATAMIGALAAYYRKIPVAHVEAGLRSGDKFHPWPEEINRRVITSIADLHFAPTQRAAQALLDEQILPNMVHVTGNTVIDALRSTLCQIERDPQLCSPVEPLIRRCSGRRIVLATIHRRENFGTNLDGILAAIREIAMRRDVAVILPVHPNPSVSLPVRSCLAGLQNVALIEPPDYACFVRLLSAAELVLTDSGGVQEEAPALGKPVLIMRETTERPEGIEAGTAILVGTDPRAICSAVFRLLDDSAAYERMVSVGSPFGDGRASQRIADLVARAHSIASGSAR